MTAVPQLAGMPCSRRYATARGFIQELEHGANRAPELFTGILRKRFALDFFDLRLEIGDKLLPILGRKLGVENYAFVFFVIFQDLFKMWCSMPRTTFAYIWMKRR